MATLWFQKSAERKALCLQAYQIAELRVQQFLDTTELEGPFAVITDVDETVLDNSPSDALGIKEGVSYSPERWKKWTDLAEAEALPGSLDFANFLSSQNIELFYLSNRNVAETEPTLRNLRRLGFPFADSSHLLLRDGSSSKVERREQIMDKHYVVMLLGDNLADFHADFEDRSNDDGLSALDKWRSEFGRKFIVFPNPMYGNWTKPYTFQSDSLSKEQLAEKRKESLESYQVPGTRH